MDDQIKSETKKIVQIIVNVLKIEEKSLCFCGSGKEYKDCCNQKTNDELTFTEKAFESVLKYKDSQGGTIKNIPKGLFNKFERSSINRLHCLYPGCIQKTASCHLTPVNILRLSFGDHCLEYKTQDGFDNSQFIKRGVAEAGTLDVFCSYHDNKLFKEVDPLNIDFNSKKEQFLLSFKVISFSLRNVQWLLGIDSQTAIFTPALILQNKKSIPTNTNYQIDISYLVDQYTRFKVTHGVFMSAVDALNRNNWDFFSYSHRDIDYKNNIFFAGFINPSHDLENNRINKPQNPVNMTCNIFTKDGKLHVLFAPPGEESKKAYSVFLKQLENLDDETFIKVVNNILTSSAEKPLLPEDFPTNNDEINKIKNLRQKMQIAMKGSSSEIFDLKATESVIRFISLNNS